jgi:hypothetical protein
MSFLGVALSIAGAPPAVWSALSQQQFGAIDTRGYSASMGIDAADQASFDQYLERLLEHLTQEEAIHLDVAASYVRVFLPVIEDSFRQDFPEELCAKRLAMANWKSMNRGGPSVGFHHDLSDPPDPTGDA